MVTISEGCSEWTDYGVIVICYLSADECAVVKEVLRLVGLLGAGCTKQDIAVAADVLLCLKLGGHKLVVDVLHVAYAGKRHLLFYIVVESVATDGVAEDWRNDAAEEQTAVEHGLECEAGAESE